MDRGYRISVRVLLAVALCALSACTGFPRMVVPHDPLTAEEHAALGGSYQAQGLHDLAAREFRAALDRQSEYVPALIGLGNLSFDAGALTEAEDYYRRALDVAPADPRAKNNLAMVYLKRGEKLNEAERLANSALEQGGTFKPYILDTLANLYLAQGRTPEARKALTEAEALASPHDLTLRKRLVESRQKMM
jgi:tetratricopeptide (TPR) repeat protein